MDQPKTWNRTHASIDSSKRRRIGSEIDVRSQETIDSNGSRGSTVPSILGRSGRGAGWATVLRMLRFDSGSSLRNQERERYACSQDAISLSRSVPSKGWKDPESGGRGWNPSEGATVRDEASPADRWKAGGGRFTGLTPITISSGTGASHRSWNYIERKDEATHGMRGGKRR